MSLRSWGRACLGLLILAGAGVGTASADQTLTLNGYNSSTPIYFSVDSNHYDPVYGGDIVPSTLNGRTLTTLYCIQYAVDVNVPGTYQTAVTSDGTVDGGQAVTNAHQVAWLIDHIAPGAVTADQQAGLQLAIWKEVTPSTSTFTVDAGTSTAVAGYYTSYLAALNADPNSGSTPLSDLLWLTPHNDAGTQNFQALVTVATPEPSTLFGGALAASGMAFTWFRRRRRANAFLEQLAGGIAS